jgi:hypothetical protein
MWVESCNACGYEGGGTISRPVPELPVGSPDVFGYFQLSHISQLGALRAILPDLASVPLHALAERLREHSFQWSAGSLFSYEARDYQTKAAEHGFTFIIENTRNASS